jgi:DNA polymerase I
MIVSASNIYQVMTRLSCQKTLALDTETTGLRPYHGDRPFLLIIADPTTEFLFDLRHYIEYPLTFHGTFASFQRGSLHELFMVPRYWFMANAKFDMAMLATIGLHAKGEIHDLQAYERVLDSTLFGKVFSLAAIAGRYGEKKSDEVEQFIKKNKLYTEAEIEGKKGKEKLLHYDQVPTEIMYRYAATDGRITYDIGKKQLARAAKMPKEFCKDLDALLANERQLVRTVFDMEQAGVRVDLSFCRRAIDFEESRRAGLLQEFRALTGHEFVDSAKCFAPFFKDVALKTTPKGAPSFDAESLATYKHPLTPVIMGIRDAKSKANYYHGFLHHADANGRIHASFNQHQARTGRFSSSNPNLQNLSKDETEDLKQEFVVRRAIVPAPGHFFAMFDFDQMEYRLMLELARCMPLIEKVLGGLDVHQATADLAGITRRQAKTTNFLTIYGGGDGILAQRLGISVNEAKQIRASIFAAAPEIRTFIERVTARAEERGFIFNWLGRRLYFPEREGTYRATNHLIQGGCADIIKVAMNRVSAYLKSVRARLVLTVHDELVIEAPEDEAGCLATVRDIMQSVYPSKLIPLTCGADHSFTSLADKIKGLPP